VELDSESAGPGGGCLIGDCRAPGEVRFRWAHLSALHIDRANFVLLDMQNDFVRELDAMKNRLDRVPAGFFPRQNAQVEIQLCLSLDARSGSAHASFRRGVPIARAAP